MEKITKFIKTDNLLKIMLDLRTGFGATELLGKLGVGFVIIFVPLGVWKLVEIIIWVIKNVSITIS